MNKYLLWGCIGLGSVSNAYAELPQQFGKLELKLNTRYWNDEGTAHPTLANPSPSSSEYEQSALGLELNYQSPYMWDWLGVDGSLYAVTKLFDSGKPSAQLLEVENNGKLDQNFATLGQLYIKAKLGDKGEIKLGRQLQDSLLLKSTNNRAVPDTFSGASGQFQLNDQLQTYMAYYDRWKPRSMDSFEKLVTENDERIDYVGLLGAKYQYKNWSVNAEYLNSKDYLKKYGAIAQYKFPLHGLVWTFNTGAFFSRDDGKLFKCGAETELDCVKGQDINNRGNGYFVDVNVAKNNLEGGIAVSKFDGFWIEDNFAVHSDRNSVLTQDHGTNPFPTSATIGPDFTNNDETAVALRLKYNWKDYVKGLKTEAKYIYGFGAHQSNISSDIEGKERYFDFTVSYALPWVKNLDVRYSFLHYESKFENANLGEKINGMSRKDWDQHRVFINYRYTF
ncbi:OprD family outer membrane porin [Acinetobacter baumannii]|uniref:OprD family outer membrane porin n=1 Tax=Acinetobacter baumannii TaxID=470 RepID=UPI000F739090|nr:OprD family outer membrane porin [Acinetobacter baumannii]RSQ71487.1 outer membrane porin, OprD family [Acinetobacter baumannii]